MNHYRCKNCGWIGSESELEYDKIESCAGDDTIEVCPKCGSMNIVRERSETMKQ